MEDTPEQDDSTGSPWEIANEILRDGLLSAYYKDVLTDSTPSNPRFLCHYTSFSGFEKIINTKSILLTPLSYTNDYSEFRSGYHKILYIFNLYLNNLQIQRSPNMDSFLREFMAEVTSNRDTLYFRQFISCWSSCDPADNWSNRQGNFELQSPDRLSMWRGYAADGHGVCLIVDLKDIKLNEMAPSNIVLYPVIYESDNEFQQRAAKTFDKFLNLFNETILNDQNHRNEIKDAMNLILQTLAITHKHPSYSEEREWRLVCDYEVLHNELSNPTLNEKNIPLENNIDYMLDDNPRAVIRLQMGEKENFDPINIQLSNILSYIYIGPCSWELQHQRMLAVKNHLRKNHFRIRDDENSEGPGVHVRYSEIPYRGRG